MKKSLIRKQPRRSARRELRPYFKNPFLEQNLPIPAQVTSLINGSAYISLRGIEAPIPIPSRSFQQLLQQMKQALKAQQSKIHNFLPTKQIPSKGIEVRQNEVQYNNWFHQVQNQPIQITTEDQWQNQKNYDIEDLFLRMDFPM